jgi:hypothetical protein
MLVSLDVESAGARPSGVCCGESLVTIDRSEVFVFVFDIIPVVVLIHVELEQVDVIAVFLFDMGVGCFPNQFVRDFESMKVFERKCSAEISSPQCHCTPGLVNGLRFSQAESCHGKISEAITGKTHGLTCRVHDSSCF